MGNTSSASSTQLPSCWWPAPGQLKNEQKVTWWNCRQDMPEPNKGSLPDLSRKEPCTSQRTAWLMFKGSRRDVGEVASDRAQLGQCPLSPMFSMLGQLSQPNPTPHPTPHTHPSPHLLYGGWKPRGIPRIFPSPLASRPHSARPQADPAKQISFGCSPLGTEGKEITKKSKDTAESPLHTQSVLLVLKQVR